MPERMIPEKERRLIPCISEVLIVSRCRERRMRMVAMDEKDFGVICVVEVDVLYAG